MEFIGGGTLQDIRKNKNLQLKLTFKLITRIAFEIASALQYLHHRSPPLVHSDLQLKNILVCFFICFLIYLNFLLFYF